MLLNCGGGRSFSRLIGACRDLDFRLSSVSNRVCLRLFGRTVSGEVAGEVKYSSHDESGKGILHPTLGKREGYKGFDKPFVDFGKRDGNYLSKKEKITFGRGMTYGSSRRGGNFTLGDFKLHGMKVNLSEAVVQKDFYKEAPAAKTQAEIDRWLLDNKVTLRGKSIPRPVFEFSEVGFPEAIASVLPKKFGKPTVIQSISWPIALSGRDIISVAMTGSGKTLAFLLPGIVHACMQSARRGSGYPLVLVLLPTRELAQQVENVCNQYCELVGLHAVCLFGGSSRIVQARMLKRGVDIVIATPGRLLDFLQARIVSLRQCSYLVLDEADRMLDMGFEPQIREIISQTHLDRQTLMFSATWPEAVRGLASDFQNDPAFLNVGSLGLAANHNITQVVKVVEETEKLSELLNILNEVIGQTQVKCLVFVETKKKVESLTKRIKNSGWNALSIHGDKTQRERDRVLDEFRSGSSPVLLATDVAARGLDVNDIKCVVNYDYPKSAEDYVHRIGRTGRCEKKGLAYTFFTPEDGPKASGLIDVMVEANQNVPSELIRLSELWTRHNRRHRQLQTVNRSSSYKGRSYGHRKR